MFVVRVITAVALLSAACSAVDPELRFFFPSSQLLLDMPDARVSSGHGHRVSVSGEQHESAKEGGRDRISNAKNGGIKEESGISNIKEPSKCVWAILACCVAGSQRVNQMCFEEKECHGNFWDESPCRRESAAAAYRIAMRYFALKESMKREEMAPVAQGAAEPTPHSPFDPIGPLPSREDAEML